MSSPLASDVVAARALLRADVARRLCTRVGMLVMGGVVGAVYCALILLLTAPLLGLPQTGPAALGKIGRLFSANVDPVLPALLGTLLAFAVIRAAGFASTVIIHSVSAVGGMCVAWAALSILSIIGSQTLTPLSQTIAALALAAVGTATAAAIAEVLPVSEHRRREHVARRISGDRDRVIRLHARVAASRLVRSGERPSSPRTSRAIAIAWCAVVPTAPAIAFVAYAVGEAPEEAGSALAVGAFIVLLLIAAVASARVAVLGRFEESDGMRRVVFGLSLGLTFTMLAAVIALGVQLWLLDEPLRPVALASFAACVLIIMATVPRLPFARSFARAVVAQRSFALQRRGLRDDRVRAALDTDVASAAPASLSTRGENECAVSIHPPRACANSSHASTMREISCSPAITVFDIAHHRMPLPQPPDTLMR